MIQGEDSGRDQIHIPHPAADSGSFDKIADIIGLIDENHSAGGEIGEGVLKSETDDETGNTKNRRESDRG